MWSEETVKAMLIALATISGPAPLDAGEEQPDPPSPGMKPACGRTGVTDAQEITRLQPNDRSPPGASAR